MDWDVIVVEPALSWLHTLRQEDRPTLIQISKAITALRQEGPAMGRPLVDTVKGSQLANLKELRPGSSGDSEVRLLFVFDPLRRAVFLVGGNKAGNWQSWYRSAIPRAEKAYEDYLTQSEEETP
ncbi:type II toxin-antitoxin system RelE/ParE family toxin [Streptomyces sp. NPDC059533]|uniref:type II toxin-antitoxin system RelE/ParE family toxin n=1 Tax=unclassified Streptomyces TaxID=2593676 RepID=UPI0036C28DF6